MTNEYHTNKNMNTWYIFELLKYILYHQISILVNVIRSQ